MPEIMKANLLQVILLNEPCEVFRHIVRPQEFAALVDADVVEIISAIGLLEEAAEHLKQQNTADMNPTTWPIMMKCGFVKAFIINPHSSSATAP